VPKTAKKKDAAKAKNKASHPQGEFELVGASDSSVRVTVDVSELIIGYWVLLDGFKLAGPLNDQNVRSWPLAKGKHVLTWSFEHAEKDWSHKMIVQVDGETAVTVSDKSEKNKDIPVAHGRAIITLS
jgi:hypothetical protein